MGEIEIYDGKPIYAVEHVTNPGSRRVVEPGQELRNAPVHVIRSLQERGLVTDNAAAAKKAAEGESDRKRDVERQQKSRATKGE